jgi:hypothetical protein
VALVAQGNNSPHDEVVQLLELENTKLQWSINIDSNIDMHNMGMSMPPSTRLLLTYYINQAALVAPLSIFKTLENHIAEFNKHVDGSFVHRSVEPFRGEYATTIKYEIVIRDYDHFSNTVSKLARAKVDAQFTQALEAKLSES